MPQITLNDVVGGYNLSAINSNFNTIEDHINSNILHRVSIPGNPNAMNTDMDMNGKRIFNLPVPTLPHEAARLADIVAGGGGGSSPTNLSTTVTASNVTINSDTGTDALIPAATNSDAGVMLPVQVTKLSGIANGATANDTDANLKNRNNHTGTQTASTISDFSEAVDDRVSSLLVPGVNITMSYDDGANTLTINSTASGGGGGDVTGPASSVNNNIVLFDGLTGKLIKDGGKALPTGAVVGTSDTQTLSGKSISLTSNTITGTLAEFNTACSDADFATITGTETLTNKTLTSPSVNGGTIDSQPIGFRNIPQITSSANYTFVLTDAGKHLLHPSADTTARTFTIPANASVAYPLGTALTIVNQNGAGVLTIAITSDTMRLAGTGTTGSRTLAANGVATALKITSTEWIISGTGLT